MLTRRRSSKAPPRRRPAEEALALIATCHGPRLAEMRVAQAEVSRLAGAPGEAEASLRTALQRYADWRMAPLAKRTRGLLASLTEQRARC